jgi:RNA polymerase sigma-70 factor (ECF subfamily)
MDDSASPSAAIPAREPAWRLGPSDGEIVERVRAGDRASYEILMRRHNQRVYRAVRSILADESEVEDVMQDAYLSAYRGLGAFAGRARFSTWLVRIAVHHAIDRVRRSGRFVPFDPLREDELEAWTGAASRTGDPERALGDRELARRLEDAIDALPAPFRTAWVLRELEGMTTSDAAECLGVEEGTVKTRLHRARRLLREALGPELGAARGAAFRFAGARCDRIVAGVLERARQGACPV